MNADALSIQDIREFHDNGYLLLRDMVPQHLRDAAMSAINMDLGKGVDPEQVRTFNAQSWCPSIRMEPTLTDLFNATRIPHVVDQLMGPGKLKVPLDRAQIALRFPHQRDVGEPLRPHIDGMGTGVNGGERGSFVRDFTAVCVIMLSDLPQDFSGNFSVWPGSHHVFEKWFKEHGPDGLKDGWPKIDYPHEPVQCCGRSGDVVLVHHELGHGAAPNLSPNVRYAAIYRLKHVDVDTIRESALTDIWREWDGVRNVLGEGS
jgi:hypothetical protein